MTPPQTATPTALAARYTEFWHWFCQRQQSFFQVVKSGERIAEDFFELLTPALDHVKEGLYFQTGMLDNNTAELVISAEGALETIAFVEDLVGAAPVVAGWKFTALKTATDIKDVSIHMAGFDFNTDTLSFYADDEGAYLDEINLVVVHSLFTEEDKPTIWRGVLIFLETYLGELDFATTIDRLTVAGATEDQPPLVPINKLQHYLTWRQKEFVEKYEGQRHQTDEDAYAGFEVELENGNMLVAVMNTDSLAWDAKASHPWVLVITVAYDGNAHGGMPDKKTYALLDELEDILLPELPDADGYLNLGRQTANNEREIYFACQDFRRPSRVLYQLQTQYIGILAITYEIYKDKYWQSFERFGGA